MQNDVRAALVQFEQRADGATAIYRFDEGLPVFAGHFPEQPLVPGVMQIEMVRHLAERCQQRPLRLVRILRTKFTAACLPGKGLAVDLDLSPADGGVVARAKVRCDNEPCAVIKIELARA